MNRDALKTKRIGILLGGLSSERDVSLRTGAAIGKALREAGYTAIDLDVGKDIAEKLKGERIDVAFIALHGRYGEDGSIQGLLESMFIPYTGSGVLASALAMDKVAAKRAFVAAGLPVPKQVVFDTVEEALGAKLPFDLPAVVKPSREGSSVGVHIVKTRAEFEAGVKEAATHAGQLLVEQFVAGREVQGAVLDNVALGVIEVKPAREFYDYTAKYGPGSGTQYIFPAELPPPLYQRVMDVSLAAHKALGCSGASRSDVIATPDGGVVLLEINTLPGMTETSLLPKIAAGRGIPFTELCLRLLEGASLKS